MADLSVRLSKAVVIGTGMMNYVTPAFLQMDLTNISRKKLQIEGVSISIKNTIFFGLFSTDISISNRRFVLNPNQSGTAQFDIAQYKEQYPTKRFTLIIYYNDGNIAQSESAYFSEF